MQESVIATRRPDVLFVDAAQEMSPWLETLRAQYDVRTAASTNTALDLLARRSPDLLVAELHLSDGGGDEICRRAKHSVPTPTVLITTAVVERVPVALAAGCDAVLLKPFAPNLLYARMARLLRARFLELQARTHRQLVMSEHLTERAALRRAGTNQTWPTTHCPNCDHPGVISFDHASHRRDWYACRACQKVWLARRRE